MTQGPLAHDVSWLHSRLDESITAAAHEDVQHISVIAQRMLETGKLDATLGDLSNDRIDAILKLLTMRFHLRNKAEQLHITRVNHERERKATTASPRAESLADAVWTLASNGATLEQVVETVSRLDIQPTLTAHPTESRRRSVIAKQDRIAELLTIRNSGELAMSECKTLESSVRQTLSQLMATDEIRSRRLDVSDEVQNGVHYLGGSIWSAVPNLYRDLADAIENNYGERIVLPVMLRYRSWIGGDRDGNPFVTAERSAVAFADMRNAACDGHRHMLKALHRELSLSSRRVQVDPNLEMKPNHH
jgi:phosphoenolpyruvate carboxylase